MATLFACERANADHDTYGVADYGYGSGLVSDLETPLAIPGSQEAASITPRAGAEEDITSPGFRRLDQHPVVVRKEKIAEGSDLAFRGKLMLAGSYEGLGIFNRKRKSLKQVSFHRCPAAQGDVIVSGDYAFVSVDSPSSNDRESETCNNTPTDVSDSSLEKEGLRIVDISNPRKPTQAGFIETECGSHTQTLVPGEERSYIYVQSYPLTDVDVCTKLMHPEGEISVISFPTSDPSEARNEGVVDIIPTLAVTPDTIGCHDAGVLPEKDLAAFACLGAFVIADISDPAAPEFLSAVQNPLIELDHSAQLTWDGKMAIIGDEHAGAAGGGGCSPDQASPVGAMWFYDISNPSEPALEGSYSLPRVPPVDSPEEAERFRCTTHNYSILPMRDEDRYVAVSPYYSGGLSIVDFTDPAAPTEEHFYLQQTEGVNPDIWSGYWFKGRIFTNENSSGYGVGMFKAKGFGRKHVRSLGRTFNPQTQVLP
ncbi:MAG TPA: hypothetical protein VD766_08925 [Solirubrobacterales bacterium]|nr:hypothetical protein [Solirubrobacterales bacterium]